MTVEQVEELKRLVEDRRRVTIYDKDVVWGSKTRRETVPVIGFYPHVFTIRRKCGRIEAYQYKALVLPENQECYVRLA